MTSLLRLHQDHCSNVLHVLREVFEIYLQRNGISHKLGPIGFTSPCLLLSYRPSKHGGRYI
jgi:hypothetical protein